MTDFIAWSILLLLAGGAITYIVKSKKKGVKCIGCPAAGSCANAGNCAGAHDHCDTHTQISRHSGDRRPEDQ